MGAIALALLLPSAAGAGIVRGAGTAAGPGAPPFMEAVALQGAAPAPEPAPAETTPDGSASPAGVAPASDTTMPEGPAAASAPGTQAVPVSSGAAAGNRPRLLVGVAMGASIDATSSMKAMTFVVPAFAAELGFGDGALGFDIRLLSNQASGRAADSAPDRLALDLLLALRPWASHALRDLGWGHRVLRAVTLTVGFGGERLSAGPAAALRAGLVVGARVELPLTSGRDEPSELRLRLGVRRSVGGEVGVGNVTSDDTTEVLAGLAVVF